MAHLQKISKGNAGAEIIIDKVLHFRIPKANPLRTMSDNVKKIHTRVPARPRSLGPTNSVTSTYRVV